MEIVIIGSGNVATVLGRRFITAGHKINQVVGRNSKTASVLAQELDCQWSDNIKEILLDADFYLIAVPDHAIERLIKTFSLPGKLVAHTAASVSMQVLKPVSDQTGVFYPLQSLKKEIRTDFEIPILFDASDENSKKTIQDLAESISKGQVIQANDTTRLKMHVAAVIVNNFSNHLYSLAESFCEKENLQFNMLRPLIIETASRVKNISPQNLQTGPASRNDAETIKKHLSVLEKYSQIKTLYENLTSSIIQSASKEK